MEKPANWVPIAQKVRITPEEKEILKKYLHLYLKLDSEQFSVSACANQGTGFSANGSLTLNGLFQKINRLKGLIVYSKSINSIFQLLLLKIENLNLFVNY